MAFFSKQYLMEGSSATDAFAWAGRKCLERGALANRLLRSVGSGSSASGRNYMGERLVHLALQTLRRFRCRPMGFLLR